MYCRAGARLFQVVRTIKGLDGDKCPKHSPGIHNDPLLRSLGYAPQETSEKLL